MTNYRHPLVFAVALAVAASLVAGALWAQDVPEGLVPPELLESVEAPFPPAAFEAGVEADVVVQLDITADGLVENVVPLELVYYTWDENGDVSEEPREVTDDPWGFVEPAVAAVSAYRFAPARVVDAENPDGLPTPVRLTWRVGFVAEPAVAAADEGSGAAADGPDEGSGADAAPDEGSGGPIYSGTVTLAGRLLERGTRAPLAGFVVEVAAAPPEGSGEGSAEDADETGWVPVSSVVSDLDGRFGFADLAPGAWLVRVAANGYDDFVSREEVVAGERTDVTFYVERESYGEYVSRTTTTRPRREVTRTTLGVSEIQRIPGNNNDAIRVVQNLPGVARPQFNGGDVIIRGSAPEDTGFVLDDMEIPAIYHFGGLRAVFPTEFIESIDFYPGAYSARYGGALGGIVAVESNRSIPERVTGHVDTNVFDTGVWLEVPIGERTALRFGGRRSYIDAVLKPLAPALGLRFSTAPRYYDFQAGITHEINDDHVFSALIYGSDDLLDLVQEDEGDLDPDQRGGIRARLYFNGIQLRLASQLTETVSNTLTVQGYYQGLGFRLGQDLYFDLFTGVHQYRDTIEWRPNERYALRYGLDISVQPGEIRIRLPRPPKEGQEALDFEASEVIEARERIRYYTPAHFVEAELEVVEGLRLLPGLRMEYYRPPREFALDGRFGARWQATERFVLKGAVGSFHQAPQPDELSASFGNPDLGLEQATHYVLGGEVQLLDFLELNVEAFWKDLNRLVAPDDGTVVRDGETVPRVYSNGGEGRVYGLELLLRHNPRGRFFGWIAYTLSRSERRDPGDPDWRLFDFDQSHIFTALGTYSLPRNWSIGGRFRLVSGNPSTPIVGSVYDAENDVYVRVAGEPNSERSKTFHQLDIRVDKRWIFDRWTLNLYLDIQNVYNRGNQEGEVYSYDYAERADLTGLPLIPSIGLRAEF
jgi:hypothetical protein